MSSLQKRILLCEPNSTSGFLFSQALAEWEYEVHVVENGKAAVERLEAGRYPVVVISLDLPVFDRADLLDRLRSAYPKSRILLAGNPDSEEDQAILDKLPYPHLTKPYRPSMVVATFSEIFETIPDAEFEDDPEPAPAESVPAEAAPEGGATASVATAEVPPAQPVADGPVLPEAPQPGAPALPPQPAQAVEAPAPAAAAPVLAAAPAAAAAPVAPAAPVPPAAVPAEGPRGLLALVQHCERSLDDLVTGLSSLKLNARRTEQASEEGQYRVESLTNEVNALKGQLTQCQDENSAARQSLKQELQTALSELERLHLECEQAQQLQHTQQTELDAAGKYKKHSEEMEHLNVTLQEQIEDFKAQIESLEGSSETALLFAVQGLFAALPFPAVAVHTNGAIIGVSPDLCELADADMASLVGKPAAGKLPDPVTKLLRSLTTEPVEQVVSIAPPGTDKSVVYRAVARPLTVEKREVRVCVLQADGGGGTGGGGGGLGAEAGQMAEQFKETLLSLRMAAEIVATKAKEDKIREIAADMLLEANTLLASVDNLLGG